MVVLAAATVAIDFGSGKNNDKIIKAARSCAAI